MPAPKFFGKIRRKKLKMKKISYKKFYRMAIFDGVLEPLLKH